MKLPLRSKACCSLYVARDAEGHPGPNRKARPTPVLQR